VATEERRGLSDDWYIAGGKLYRFNPELPEDAWMKKSDLLWFGGDRAGGEEIGREAKR
jgi:hypothetical protein